MKAKKLLALLMASAMAVSMLAGCGSSEGETEVSKSSESEVEESKSEAAPESSDTDSTGVTFPLEEPYEIDVFVCSGDASYKFEDTAVFKVMQEKTNVIMNVTNVTLTESQEKLNVMMNSGDYPDVLIKSGISPQDLLEYGQEGIILALDDYLADYAPNYSALIDSRDGWDAVASGDGHIYSLYQVGEPAVGNTPYMWINTQWLENLGLSMPTSSDEFYEVLKAFKEQDADGDGDPNNEIPWIASSDITPVEDILPYFGFNMQGWWDPWSLSEDESTVDYFAVLDEYKEALRFIAKCYDEGLLYKDSFSITCEQVGAMGQTGTSIGVFCHWSPAGIVGAYDPTLSEEENLILQYDMLWPWEGSKRPTSGGYERGGIAITEKCEHPEIMVAWADYLYSEEGAILANYGIEGDTFDFVDGKIKVRDAQNPSTTWGEDIGKSRFAMGGGTFGCYKTYVESYDVYVDYSQNPLATQLEDIYDELNEADLLYKAWPAISMNDEESAEFADIGADVDSYRLTYRADVITGKKDLDATWDEYISTLDKMGLQTYIELMNKAYQRYLGNE
jgi:putative aldouronate transport system substrate-binding protein